MRVGAGPGLSPRTATWPLKYVEWETSTRVAPPGTRITACPMAAQGQLFELKASNRSNWPA